MSKLIAEVRFEIDVDDNDLKLREEAGLSGLMDSKNLKASDFEEITYEEVREE